MWALGQMKSSTKASVVLLLAASVVAFCAMVHGARKFEWSWFYPWVIGPYIVLLLVFCVPTHQTRAKSIAGCTAASMVLAFTCLFYVDAMWISVSSTSALIFIFAPMYLLVGGLVVWGLAWFILARRNAEKSSHGPALGPAKTSTRRAKTHAREERR